MIFIFSQFFFLQTNIVMTKFCWLCIAKRNWFTFCLSLFSLLFGSLKIFKFNMYHRPTNIGPIFLQMLDECVPFMYFYRLIKPDKKIYSTEWYWFGEKTSTVWKRALYESEQQKKCDGNNIHILPMLRMWCANRLP